MSGADTHSLNGAYALDALDEFERRVFQAHLGKCQACLQEVKELRATTAKLGIAVSRTPPETLRSAVMAQIMTLRQDSPISARAIPTGIPRMHRFTRWDTRFTAVVAGLAASVALLLGVLSVRTEHEREYAQTQIALLRDRYAPLTTLATAPDASAASGATARGGTVFVIASHEKDKAVLLLSGLPAPAAGSTYQVWLIGHGHNPRSVALVDPGATTQPLTLPFGGLGSASKIGLTTEPAGGSPEPTSNPIALFDLPS